MNITRIFANAIARRVAFLVVAAVLGFLVSIFDAKADATCYTNSTGGLCANESEAYINAKRAATYACTSQSTGNPIGTVTYNTTNYTTAFVRFNCTTYQPFPYTRSFPASQRCPVDEPIDPATGQCSTPPPDCDKPGFTTTGPPRSASYVGSMTSGSLYCESLGTDASCAMAAFDNGDGTWTSEYLGGAACTPSTLEDECEALSGFYWNATLSSCIAINETCAANEVKDEAGNCQGSCPVGLIQGPDGTCKPEADTCPPGNVKAPSGQCLPGDGQCAVGEAKKADGTCGIDANGDGVADADDSDPNNDPDEESFSGGDSCNAPPACAGSPIMCGQARIQWRIDCNTRENVNISGGSCASIPICTGDKCKAMEYSQLLMQWRTACALEKASGGDEEAGSTTADYMAAQAQANKNEADAIAAGGDGHEGVSESDIWGSGVAGSISETILGGGGGTCSAPTWTLMGEPIDLPGDWWSLASWIAALLVACAYIWVGWRLM